MAERRSKSVLTQAEVREFLHYDPETGVFLRIRALTWRNRESIGRRAGGFTKNGYRTIAVKSGRFLEHRLAFLWMTGAIPEEIDHINGDPADNRWANLRPVNRAQNLWNAARSKRNSSGCKGVSWHALSGKWRARIDVDGRLVYLGCFWKFSDAVKARRRAEFMYHGEFVRGSSPSNLTKGQ